MKDWHTMNLYYSRARAGIFSAVLMPFIDGSAQSWSDMAGE